VRFEGDARPSASDAKRACALILLHVEEMHHAAIQHLKCAASVWKTLEQTSRDGRCARTLRLRRELHQTVKSTSEPVQGYVARLRQICVELMAVGVTVGDDEAIPAFVAGRGEASNNASLGWSGLYAFTRASGQALLCCLSCPSAAVV
jgi:hypothetical protein